MVKIKSVRPSVGPHIPHLKIVYIKKKENRATNVLFWINKQLYPIFRQYILMSITCYTFDLFLKAVIKHRHKNITQRAETCVWLWTVKNVV